METKKSLSGYRTTGVYDSPERKAERGKKTTKKDALMLAPSEIQVEFKIKKTLKVYYNKNSRYIKSQGFYHPIDKKWYKHTIWAEDGINCFAKDTDVLLYDAHKHPDIHNLIRCFVR